jgi:hypothetical protein
MKTKNYRLFLLGFVTVSLVLLTGFKNPTVNDAVLAETHAVSAEVKKVQLSSNESRGKSRQKRINNKHLASNAKDSIAKDTELQKSLDLSISFKESENAWLQVDQNTIVRAESSNMFTANKKKPRAVDLDGQMIMSQEPEADKRKSLDGAAIVINLKR